MIGLASSEEKRALVERLGADATVDSRAEDLREAILDANGGERVDAILHMSGGDAFDAELSALAPLGRMVVFGIASREQREVSTAALLRGSKAVIGFWLAHLLMRRELVAPMIAELLGAVAAGELEVTVGGVYPLSEAARAHEDLIGRRTSGKLLLDPTQVTPRLRGPRALAARSSRRSTSSATRSRPRSRSRRSRSCSPATT